MSAAAQLEFVKDIMGGGKVEKSHDGKIVIITTSEQTLDHIAAWTETIAELYRTWPKNQLFMMLFDASNHPLNPRVRQNLMGLQANALAESLTTRIAYVVRESDKNELSVFANLTSMGSHRVKVLLDWEEALEWLERGMN